MSKVFEIKCAVCGKKKKVKRSWARFCSKPCKDKSSILTRAEEIKKEKSK